MLNHSLFQSIFTSAASISTIFLHYLCEKLFAFFISDPLLLQFMKSFNSRLLILCRLI